MRIEHLQPEHIQPGSYVEHGTNEAMEGLDPRAIVAATDGIAVFAGDEPVVVGGVFKRFGLVWAAMTARAKGAHVLAFSRWLEQNGPAKAWTLVTESQPQMYRAWRAFGGRFQGLYVAPDGTTYYVLTWARHALGSR